MVYYRHNLTTDLRAFTKTLGQKVWLDKHGYFYDLFNTLFRFGFNYERIVAKIENELKEKHTAHALKEQDYIIYLSKFGVYGNYELPNKIYVNVNRSPAEIAKTIIHEITHLEVEPIVQEQKMSQEEKEKLVDELNDKEISLDK